MIQHLICDINRRIYMSYSPCQRCPESRTAEPGSHAAARAPTSACGRRATRQAKLHLQTTGLSLPRAGAATQTPGCSRRCKGLLHRQAVPQSCGQPSPLRRFHRIDFERNCRPGLLGGIASPGRPWLTGRRPGNEQYKRSISLIACYRKNWRRRMNYSRPPKPGLRSGRSPNRSAAIRRP